MRLAVDITAPRTTVPPLPETFIREALPVIFRFLERCDEHFNDEPVSDASRDILKIIVGDEAQPKHAIQQYLSQYHKRTLQDWSKCSYLRNGHLDHLASLCDTVWRDESPVFSEGFVRGVTKRLYYRWQIVLPLASIDHHAPIHPQKLERIRVKGRHAYFTMATLRYAARMETRNQDFREDLELLIDTQESFSDLEADVDRLLQRNKAKMHQARASTALNSTFPKRFAYPYPMSVTEDEIDENANIAVEVAENMIRLLSSLSFVRLFKGPVVDSLIQKDIQTVFDIYPAIFAVCNWGWNAECMPKVHAFPATAMIGINTLRSSFLLGEDRMYMPVVDQTCFSGIRHSAFLKLLCGWLFGYNLPALKPCNEAAVMLVNAYAQERPALRAVLICSAMEKLCNVGKDEPVGFKLRESLPHWLPLIVRKRAQETIIRFYRHRCSIVHASKDTRGAAQSAGFVDLTTHTVARCIVEMVAWQLDRDNKEISHENDMHDETDRRRLGIASCSTTFVTDEIA